ncbi:MAG TPA: ABC transporter permease [Ignavibacteria bacterium]|nr:ABC transporter permease [Ignavibacteria bacterium]
MNSLKRLMKTAFRSIYRNKMRSMLTALGIIIGVSSVIIMVAIGSGSGMKMQEQINSLGTNLIMISPGEAKTGGVSKGGGSLSRLTFEDVARIKKSTTLLSGISPVVRASEQVIGGAGNWSTSVYGVSTDYFTIKNRGLESGEFFTDRDVQASRKVAILGITVVENLFPDEPPLGKQIRIRNIPFTVIGVLKEKGEGGGMGNDQDDQIMIPSTTALYRLKGGQYIDMINASAVSIEEIDNAKTEIEEILRDSHRLNEGEENDFTIRTQAEITETASEMTETITLLLGSIAGVSLVVGGIGIMNIMLVSVTERTREIGIRMSVGARSRDVLAQFLTEAAVLSLAAGVTGILLSVAVSVSLNKFTSIRTSLSFEIILIAFLFSAAVGVFFGFYPARKAASLNPIEALRYE